MRRYGAPITVPIMETAFGLLELSIPPCHWCFSDEVREKWLTLSPRNKLFSIYKKNLEDFPDYPLSKSDLYNYKEAGGSETDFKIYPYTHVF